VKGLLADIFQENSTFGRSTARETISMGSLIAPPTADDLKTNSIFSN